MERKKWKKKKKDKNKTENSTEHQRTNVDADYNKERD